jgi:tetratricopeptide (TPR) repeat protein
LSTLEKCLALGEALAARGDRAGAAEAYQQALAADAGSILACRKLAVLYAELGRIPEALEMSRRLLRAQPADAFARAHAASMLEGLGRLEEAYELVAPLVRAGNADAFAVTTYGRICQRLEPPRDEALPLLERFAADPGVPARRRVKLLWVLVHSYDALGRYDEAFARARTLKALECSASIARPPVPQAEIDAAIESYTAERLARLPRASRRSSLPVFIVGMMRSGTTLAEQIIGAHPDAYGAGELVDITSIAMRALPAARPYPDCLDALDQAGVDAHARAYEARLRARAPEAKRVVDKMMGNFQHLGLISLLCPSAPVIHCRRHPLDTCLSLYFLPDASDTGTLEAVGRAYVRYRRIMARWRALLELRMLELGYEALIAEPERTARELVQFCGLAWDARCLEFHRAPRIATTFSYHQVRKPLYDRSVGRYRNYEKHLGPLVEALGEHAAA